MAKKKTKKKSEKKYSGTELDQGYQKGTDDNLFLNRPFKALSNLSIRKNGKEVPVNVQISDYLKSMKLLEVSIADLEKTVEKSNNVINSRFIVESKIIKRKIRGRTYSTTKGMIEAVKAYDMGKIDKKELYEITSWAENPELAVQIARIIGGQKNA